MCFFLCVYTRVCLNEWLFNAVFLHLFIQFLAKSSQSNDKEESKAKRSKDNKAAASKKDINNDKDDDGNVDDDESDDMSLSDLVSDSDDEEIRKDLFEEVKETDTITVPAKLAKTLDAEGLAIAQQMIAKRRKQELMDQAFNRYAFNDDPMPAWFADEEKNHRVPTMPITKEMAEEIKVCFW